MSESEAVEIAALRAAIGRIESGGKPPHHPPPGSPPDTTPSGGDSSELGSAAVPADADSRRRSRRSTAGAEARGDANARDPQALAKAIVLRQLTNSPKTRAQLEQALARRECDPEVAREVLDRLTDVGLIDDEAYARMYIRSKQNTRGLAKSALRRELRTKGVSADLAADALGEVSDAAEEERARALVRTRLPRLHGLERSVQVRRLAGLLARKGYPPGLASKIVFEELDRAAEHTRD